MDYLERIGTFLAWLFGGSLRGFERLITKVFGSSNERRIRQIGYQQERDGTHSVVPGSLLVEINQLEEDYKKLSDEELGQSAEKFRKRLSDGETLDDLLPDAFAAVREAGQRFLRMRHYDVQMVGGYFLHKGLIAEMITGEGKTLVATLPAYLNALAGSVHVVTVNDYLARRDMEWMAPLYMGLGLTVGAIYSGMDPGERQAAYACDITYGTNNEFGFDYLRDKLCPAARGDNRFSKDQQQVQGPLEYAIVDEVDNILIDEARTPLIISGKVQEDAEKFRKANEIAKKLRRWDVLVLDDGQQVVGTVDKDADVPGCVKIEARESKSGKKETKKVSQRDIKGIVPTGKGDKAEVQLHGGVRYAGEIKEQTEGAVTIEVRQHTIPRGLIREINPEGTGHKCVLNDEMELRGTIVDANADPIILLPAAGPASREKVKQVDIRDQHWMERSDTLTLDDGREICGEIIKEDEDAVTIATQTPGDNEEEIEKVAQKAVKKTQYAKPTDVLVLPGGQEIQGQIVQEDRDSLVLESEGETPSLRSVPRAQIKGIRRVGRDDVLLLKDGRKLCGTNLSQNGNFYSLTLRNNHVAEESIPWPQIAKISRVRESNVLVLASGRQLFGKIVHQKEGSVTVAVDEQIIPNSSIKEAKPRHFVVNEKDRSAHLTDEGVREAEKLAGVESFYSDNKTMLWPHLIDNALRAHHLYQRDVNYVVKEYKLEGGQKEQRVVIVDEFTGRLMEGRHWSDGLHQAVESKEGVRIKEEQQTLATITLQNYFKLYNKLAGMTGTAMTEAGEFWKIYALDVVAIPPNKRLQRIEHPDKIYRSEREKYEAMAEEIERINKWDVLHLKEPEEVHDKTPLLQQLFFWRKRGPEDEIQFSGTDAREIVGKIEKETDDEIVIALREGNGKPQPRKSAKREKKTFQKSEIDCTERHGRPILVGTTSIEKSEQLARLLDQRGIEPQVLNAKQHTREARIVAQAGRKGAVTIATNMAGRGTDIILGGNPETMAWDELQKDYKTRLDVPKDKWDALVKKIQTECNMEAEGEEVRNLGGLHVVGTERHEARRIDLQLRGRSGRQGDPGSSRFYLSLEDDLMRIFAGEWVKNILTRLGMEEGQAIESKMVSRRIEGAQKKIEERHFEARKNLVEYDEVMDQQRKNVYQYRQDILDGVDCRERILEMLDGEVTENLDEYLDADYGVETFATWVGSELKFEFDGRDFRDMDFESAVLFAKDEAERMAEGLVHDALEENLPNEVEREEWNWEALAKLFNTRWHVSIRDRELKKMEREEVEEFLIERVKEALQKADLREGAVYLKNDYGVRTALEWVHNKFGVELSLDEIKGQDPGRDHSQGADPQTADVDEFDSDSIDKVKQGIVEAIRQSYNQREYEYPVHAGMKRFSTKVLKSVPKAADPNNLPYQVKYDRRKLVEWARNRFDINVDDKDILNKAAGEVQEALVELSRKSFERSQEIQNELNERFGDLFNDQATTSPDNQENLVELSKWTKEILGRPFAMKQLRQQDYDPDELAKLAPSELNRRISIAYQAHFCPEVRKLERDVLFQVLDAAWNQHLSDMERLRDSVGLRGYAQVDPKVEYKREGQRYFEDMWKSIRKQVTHLVFNVEELDEQLVRSTFVETSATHAEAKSEAHLYESQRAAAPVEVKLEPIKKPKRQIGVNDPCYCGSGKKYKKCCRRKDLTAA